nr:MAG TPA: hypothetical protein [Caudoviricetes sp.]
MACAVACGVGICTMLLRYRLSLSAVAFLKTSKQGCGGGQPLHKDSLN